MLPELTQHDYSAALDAVVEGLLAELPATQPPINALELARALKLEIAWDAGQRGRGRIVRLRDFVGGPDPRPERLQWAVAHEIGEACAHQVFDYLCVDPREAPPAARENVANHLAGRLLLPREWFLADARRLEWDVVLLKERYATASHELIARRTLDFSCPVVISIFDHGRLTMRQTNLPRRPPELLPPERAAWQIAHHEQRAARETAAGCQVQAWPVHEPEWKREILRTVLDEADEVGEA